MAIKQFIVHIFDGDIWGVGTNELEAKDMSVLLAKDAATFDNIDASPEDIEKKIRTVGYCVDVTVSGTDEEIICKNAKIILANAIPKTSKVAIAL